jgi:DNA glycosylase AlkZ-like
MADNKKLRTWWSHKQGLDGSLKKSGPSEVLEKTGWARSVGGVNPYITLFARAHISREAAEAAAARQEIHELPSARGCTHVLPASDFALGLKVGQGFGDESEINIAIKYLGVTAKEIDKLMDRVLNALRKEQQDPRQLKGSVGGAIRNLGDAGKKRGITTTLPLALGRLQSLGKIRRVPANGRLDQQRFSYALWNPSPLEKFRLSAEEAYAELARRYFSWIGPASLAHFRWFSGLGAKVAKAAVDAAGVVPFDKETGLLIYPNDLEAFHKFQLPKEPQYALVSSIDSVVLLRRDMEPLIDDADRNRKVTGEKGTVVMGGLQDLVSHAILDRGRVIGLWEYDPSAEKIAWKSFTKADVKLKNVVAETESFIRDQLGDARSFSRDSPESRLPRIKSLRA